VFRANVQPGNSGSHARAFEMELARIGALTAVAWQATEDAPLPRRRTTVVKPATPQANGHLSCDAHNCNGQHATLQHVTSQQCKM
jgi:hypothetical protein